MKRILLFATFLVAGWAPIAWAASDTGEAVPRERYANREILLDPTAKDCPETTRSLVQVRDNLYRHTNAEIPFRHSGLVLITSEGALVIDPALTCTATWLRDEIKTRFNVDVRYLIQTHAHFDHIAGSQVFQEAGATVVAHRNAVEPIVGEKLPTAVPGKVFDKEMTIELGGETIKLYHVAPSHSNSMVMVLFPRHRALQCSDVCESKTPPYMDFLDFYYDGWIQSLDWVIAQDVDFIDVGHYTPATKEDQRALRDYMVDLHAQVLSLVRQGQTWDQVWRNVKVKPEYQKWYLHDYMRVPNILGMHRWVTNHRRGVW